MVVTTRSQTPLKEKSSDHTPASIATPSHKDKSDVGSILLLLLLYTLQGIPMGLSSSIPFILQSKVGYTAQATFSLVSWPFSLKLLWAPIVDSVYHSTLGRRKSWLVPVQLLCSLVMIAGGSYVDSWLGEGQDEVPQVLPLTMYFFLLYFLMATQDIAVDGWALTMLSKSNVGWASTCNTVGQTLGYFMAYVGFLALHDPATCNAYFRTQASDSGLVSLPEFLQFWGTVMLVTTLGVWVFKTERRVEHSDKPLSIRQTYGQLAQVCRLPAVMTLTAVLLTCRMGFAATDAVGPLKLVEYGLPKEKLALLSPVLIPLGIVLPLILSKFSRHDRPFHLFLLGYGCRLVLGLVYATVVYTTPSFITENGGQSSSSGDISMYYLSLLVIGAAHEVVVNMMFVSIMTFFSRISDPAIGGTYMTYLNTISNLGSKWTSSLALACVDALSHAECQEASSSGTACDTAEMKESCLARGGHCLVVQEGFYIETGICTMLGLAWFGLCAAKLMELQELDVEAWRVVSKTKKKTQ